MSEPVKAPEGFHKILNAHGYGFQFSVLGRAEQLFYERKSPWKFEAAEFPVSVHSEETKIDFLLKRDRTVTFLVAECKNVNPSLGRWFFVKAPYTHRNANKYSLFFESLDASPLHGITARSEGRLYNLSSSIYRSTSTELFHIGMEAKDQTQQGNKQGSMRGGLESAIGQVLRGTNGMVEYLANHQQILRTGFLSAKPTNPDTAFSTWFIPAIFTTAKLWVSDVNLSSADLTTGDFSPSSITSSERRWLWLNYNQSQGLRHSVNGKDHDLDLAGVMDADFTRSVAIINESGMEDFLTHSEI